jgi:peptide/nickel transport system permease protein
MHYFIEESDAGKRTSTTLTSLSLKFKMILDWCELLSRGLKFSNNFTYFIWILLVLYVFKYLVRRILTLTPLVFALSVAVFFMIRLTPTDPIVSITNGRRISDETRRALIAQYALDKPLISQYALWITKAFQGDLGDSFKHRQPVTSLLAARLPTTLQLTMMSAVFAVVLAIPIGVVSAARKNTALDRILSGFTVVCASSPSFLAAIVLMLLFSFRLKWFPAFGTGKNFGENLYYLALPSFALSLNLVALIARITRSHMITELESNYALTEIAKGTAYWRILLSHCLKNALIPVITVGSIQIGTMIVGAVMVENVFALGGLGALLIEGIKNADYPVVQSIIVLLVIIFLFLNLVVDTIYTLIDPRIRAAYGQRH